MLVSLSHVDCELVKEIGVFAVSSVSNYDAVFGFVAFSCVEEDLWSDEITNGWFPYSWDTDKVSNVPSFELFTKKGRFPGLVVS